MPNPTIVRVPRAHVYLESSPGSGYFVDHGRIDEGTITLEGDPIITEDFDPATCVRYESARDFLRLSCTIELSLASGIAANITDALMSRSQTVAASVGNVFTSPDSLPNNSLLSLGWAPAGSVVNGVFTPDAFSSVEDSIAAALALGTDYEWVDARAGIVRVLDISGYTLPLIFTGDSRATERAVLGDASGAYREMMLSIVDQRNQCTGEVVRLWRATVAPGAAMPAAQALDSDEGLPIPLTLQALEDPQKAADSQLGNFGYWEQG